MPTCLFVCADNALASRLAEGLFNAQAPRGWRATSAGVAPASAVDPRTETTLSALGYPVPPDAPRAAEKDLLSFMRVVVTVGIAADAPLPELWAAKVDLKLDVPDPRPLPADQMVDWLTKLNDKLPPVMALCRERTPRPFG